VCEGDIDHVVGYVDAKDLFQRVLNNQPISLADDSLVRKVLIVPDKLTLSEVLEQFRQVHEDFAVIVNEYSLVVGVVTLNDVMSTVMGDLVGGLRMKSRSCSATRTRGSSMASPPSATCCMCWTWTNCRTATSTKPWRAS
jgi:Mg2+/Co2+ transporter CorB